MMMMMMMMMIRAGASYERGYTCRRRRDLEGRAGRFTCFFFFKEKEKRSDVLYSF